MCREIRLNSVNLKRRFEKRYDMVLMGSLHLNFAFSCCQRVDFINILKARHENALLLHVFSVSRAS